MASLLVIGGTGFFGKSIVDLFLRGGLSKWGIDEIVVGSRTKPLELDGKLWNDRRIKWMSLDIRYSKKLPSFDYIINAAASTKLINYLRDPDVERENIVRATSNFIEVAAQLSVKTKLLYTSSGAIYGPQPIEITHLDEDYKSELMYENPGKRAYQEGKKIAEKLIIDSNESGMNIMIARCFAFIGRFLPHDEHFALGNFLRDAKNGSAINVETPNLVYRSYMHADDLATWLMTICDSNNRVRKIYNVGSDEAIEIRNLAKLVGDLYGCNINSRLAENPRVERYIPSIKNAKKDLGLKLSLRLRDGLLRIED